MICRAPLENDVLVLDTGAMQREFAWNRGNPITRKIVDHARGRSWSFVGTDADAAIPGSKEAVGDGELTTEEVAATAVHPAFLGATVTAQLGGMFLRRTFRLYENCPAIACDLYLKGRMPAIEASHPETEGNLPNLEDAGALLVPRDLQVTRLDSLSFPGRHQRVVRSGI